MTAGSGVVDIPPTVVVTGHFPPRKGGVQTFTWELVRRLPSDRLVVVAQHDPGAETFDSGLDFPVHRRHGYALNWRLGAVVRHHGATAAWIPAMAPIGLFAGSARRAGVERIVASTHGQELGWLRVAPTRASIRRIARAVDILTYLGPTTLRQLTAAVDDPRRLHWLAGGVDTDVFHPTPGRARIRAALGVVDRPLVVSVARLVRRKGHDLLLRAWPQVLSAVPDAALLVVGDGPFRRRLEMDAGRAGVAHAVRFTGSVPTARLAELLGAADVFVLPCRDDRAGLQTEGLGLSTLEASAVGVPVIVGRSGGSADALLEGKTGLLVDAADQAPIAAAVVALLRDPVRAAAMGGHGRTWVRHTWSWDVAARRLAALLRGEDPGRVPPGGDQ